MLQFIKDFCLSVVIAAISLLAAIILVKLAILL